MSVEHILDLRNGLETAYIDGMRASNLVYKPQFVSNELGFERVLFVVHRNQIAKQAIKSFRKVFGGNRSMGMVSGTLGVARI